MSRTAKAVLLGDRGVGKTAIYTRLQSNTFNPEYIPTIGGSFGTLPITFERVTGEIGLWDTAGQERYRTIVPLYFQNAAVVLLCFDVTSTASFDSIEAWHELVMSHSPTDGHFFLIGNKSDLVDQRTVPLSDAQQKSENLNADVYIETSAATGMGLNQILSEFGRILADRPPENDGSETKDGSLPTDSSLVEADRNQCC